MATQRLANRDYTSSGMPVEKKLRAIFLSFTVLSKALWRQYSGLADLNVNHNFLDII